MLTKVVMCALTLSRGNADNERSLSANKKTLTKDRTNLSLVTLNGLRTTEDAIQSIDVLSNVEITKQMLSLIKGARKAYYEHVEMEKKKQRRSRLHQLLRSRDKRRSKKRRSGILSN